MLLLHNARIWTGAAARPWTEQLLIDRGEIVSWDHPGEWSGESLDLGGRLVTPGFWDSHLHLFDWSLALDQIDLAGSASCEEMLARVAGAQPGAGGWIRGQGWNETGWPDGPPDRLALDRVTTAPCLLWRADLHTVVVNSAALKIAGLWEHPGAVEGGIVEQGRDGRPNGVLRELAILKLGPWLANPSPAELRDSLLRAQSRLHRYGITALCDQRLKDYPDGSRMVRALAGLNREGELQLRVSCNLPAHELEAAARLGLSQGLGDERLRLGHVKFFCDGTLGSLTAKMLEPFRDQVGTGVYLTSPDQLRAGFARAAEQGFAVSVHAIGDRANRECLDLLAELPRLPVPHRIEHVQILADADVDRLAELDLTASMQPGHILDDQDRADQQLGERARLAYRLRSLADSGARLSFGSDGPVSRVDPGYGLQAAVQRRWQEQEAIDLERALSAYTREAAEGAGFERVCGRLAPGLSADLAVFAADLFHFGERPLQEASVDLTMVDGRVVWQSDALLDML